MAQCKKSNCREEAVPYGKRYCPTHMAEYKAKQAAYAKVQATLRCCETCGEKLTKTRHDAGETKCSRCYQEHEAAIIQSEEDGRKRRERMARLDQLERADTVAALRDYIREHLFR